MKIMAKTIKIDQRLLRDTKYSKDVDNIIKWFTYITIAIVVALLSLIFVELLSANFENATDWCTRNTGDKAYCEQLAR